MKNKFKLQSALLIIGIILISCFPAFSHTEESKGINSYWVSDRILIVGNGEMQMDMVAAINTEKGIVIIDSGISPSLSAKHKAIIERD